MLNESMMEFWLGGYLLVLFVMTFIGNGLIPLPITAYILWMGQFQMPIPVILVGTLGTVVGWVMTEHWFRRLCENKPFLQKTIPVYYHELFQKQPGLCFFVFNALPFPWDPTRLLALLHCYAPLRLTGFLAAGRLVRYTLLVTLGAVLARYQYAFWGVLGFLLLVPVLTAVLQRLGGKGH